MSGGKGGRGVLVTEMGEEGKGERGRERRWRVEKRDGRMSRGGVETTKSCTFTFCGSLGFAE